MGKKKEKKDFQKVKFKVGKKLPKAENLTSTVFKSRAIIVKEQLKNVLTPGNETVLTADVLRRAKNPQELLAHLQHYNASFRMNSLNTVKTIVSADPTRLGMHMGALIDKVLALCTDIERDVRSAALQCLKTIITSLPSDSVQAFHSSVAAHLGCAMTHLQDAIKLDSLQLLSLILDHCPSAIENRKSMLLYNFIDQISTKSTMGKRTLKTSPNSQLTTLKWRLQALQHLQRLLCVGANKAGQLVTPPEVTSPTLFRDAFYLNVVQRNIVIYRARMDTSDGSNDDIAMMFQFVQETVPLLRECWVEVQPLQERQLDEQSLLTMQAIVDILRQMWLLFHSINIASRESKVQDVRRVVKHETAYLLSAGFPYSCLNMPSMHRRTKGLRLNLEVECNRLNLRICSLAYSLRDPADVIPSYWPVYEFLVSSLRSMALPGEELDIVLECLSSTVSLGDLPTEILKDVSSCFLNLTGSNRLTESRVIMMKQFLERCLLTHHVQRGMQEWKSAFVNLLVRLALLKMSEATSNGTLQSLCRVASCDTVIDSDSVLLLMEHYFRGYPSITTLRLLISIIYYCQEVSRRHLLLLRDYLWKLEPDVERVGCVLHALHQKLQKSGASLSMADFLSFLLSTLTGLSRDTKPVPKLEQLLCISRVAACVCKLFPNTSQLAEVVDQCFASLVAVDAKSSTYRLFSLPVATCISLLTFISESNLSLADHLMAKLITQLSCTHCMKQVQPNHEVTQTTHDHINYLLGSVGQKRAVVDATFGLLQRLLADCTVTEDFQVLVQSGLKLVRVWKDEINSNLILELVTVLQAHKLYTTSDLHIKELGMEYEILCKYST